MRQRQRAQLISAAVPLGWNVKAGGISLGQLGDLGPDLPRWSGAGVSQGRSIDGKAGQIDGDDEQGASEKSVGRRWRHANTGALRSVQPKNVYWAKSPNDLAPVLMPGSYLACRRAS